MNAVLGVALVISVSAGPAPRHSSAEILRDLRKLSVVGGALYVAAHPDDENTRLLASLANQTQVRTAYLSLTRGEGGQNLIGPEIGPSLGVIRTQELLAARRIDGAEQFFTSARDFGYSKSVDETLAFWGTERVVNDTVRVIRELRPDVIIARFAQEGGDTHGHHTASARVALEAFTKAADPAYVIKDTQPWQAKRIVWNAWSREPGAENAGAIKWNSSAYDPLLGLSYGELAAESRSMHKSQGFGAAPIHGPSPEQLVHLAGTPGATLFEGIDLSWKRVGPGSEKLTALLKKAVDELRPGQPAASVPTLLLALDAMRALPENPYKVAKLNELTQVIADCAGLFVEASASTFSVVSGGNLEVTAQVLARSAAIPVALKSVTVSGPPVMLEAKLVEGVANTQKIVASIPSSVEATNPPWLTGTPERGTWSGPERLLIAPEAPPVITADFALTIDGRALTLQRPVLFKWTDPTAGERFRPIEVTAPVVIRASTSLLLFDSAAPKELRVTVTAMADAQEGTLHLATPPTLGEGKPFSLKQKGDTAEVVLMVTPDQTSATRLIVARIAGAGYSRDLKRIEYAHIPIQTVSPLVEIKLARFDLVKGKKRIGYVAGAGDDVASALRNVGYEVTMLSDEQVASKPLTAFDAIVVGIRAYNVNRRMTDFYPALMKYVCDGGTLLVQYNTKNWLSNVPAEMGPYPFEVSQDRVTDETAEVVFELPRHRVLTAPNALTAKDFEGWVQERGLYFADKWHPKYEAPLSMHDTGENGKKGNLIIAKHGKGTFIYTGLSFFRQLPAGVPGAYRLFANLLAANGR